jgi:Fic family protein
VPPPPVILQELLDGFIGFIGLEDESLDPIVQAALLHAQFEMIHPFDDGNGRIGRVSGRVARRNLPARLSQNRT